jgi:hypothetical protein
MKVITLEVSRLCTMKTKSQSQVVRPNIYSNVVLLNFLEFLSIYCTVREVPCLPKIRVELRLPMNTFDFLDTITYVHHVKK